MDDRPAIQCRGLTKRFGPVLALDGLDLEVPQGVVFGFLGPNGAGKTTTINLLLGLLKADAGSAEALGYKLPWEGSELRARCGVLLEHPGIYERLSAEDNLMFFGQAYGVPKRILRARISELLDHFELYERRREPVGRWSRGMRQRLALIRVVLHQPPLVFLDEPTASLDPFAAADLRQQLTRLARERHVTVFLTTHNLKEAEEMCDLVGIIARGRLVALAPPRQLRVESPRSRVEIIGTGFGEESVKRLGAQPWIASVEAKADRLVVDLLSNGRVPDLVKTLTESGGEIEEIRRESWSFDEALLSLLKDQL